MFVEERLFCWVSNAGHQYDLGGVVPGGWPQNAVDVFHDPVILAPFKIVEKGHLRRDLEQMYLRPSRTPDLLALDFRAQLSGCRFAAGEILRMCDQFGPTTVKAAMRRVVETSQQAFVEKLTDLELLGIGDTQIVNRGWASIAKLPKLKQLLAYNMPVSDEALAHAGRIESLELLRVGGAASEVSDAGLKHLRSLHRLRDLHLNHCHRITDAGLESLAELPALETLDLSHTPITDPGLPHLARIKTFKSLNLTECVLSEAALDDLQDALP